MSSKRIGSALAMVIGAVVLASPTYAEPRAWMLRRVAQREIARVRYGLQQSCCAWIGGHFAEPNEQNTQQSPDLGRSKILQFSHS